MGPRRTGGMAAGPAERRAAAGSGEGGFALIGALWLLVVLSVIGLDFALEARGLAARAIHGAEHAEARLAAESCLEEARVVLAERLGGARTLSFGGAEALDPWREPARLEPDTLEVGEARCVVRLRDAGMQLHLNRATEAELRGLMTALRVDDGAADRAAQAILDWRDADAFRRARGAEAEEYAEAGLLVRPADGPFGAVHQLRQVLGVSPELYQRIAPHLTVVGSGRVNLAAAPSEVLASLPGMTDDLLGRILQARRSGAALDVLALTREVPAEEQTAFRSRLSLLLGRTTQETVEVVARAEGWGPAGAIRVAATGVVARAGDAALLVERRVR